MARKVIIDCDPGIDDAVALCLALFDPRLEVVAVTPVGGNVHHEQASRNVQSIIDQLDPPRFPRMGTASLPEFGSVADRRNMNGEDGLGNAGFAVAQLHQQHPSPKIICDEVRSAPEQVTIICLGPLTNIAQAFRRDPELATLVDRIIMTGGAVNGIGNVTPSAEFNIYCDPSSAREVFRSKTTKTLIPLDITEQVSLTLDIVEELPDEETRAGSLLHRMLPFAFRAFHQRLGMESIFLHDVVGLLAAVQPELFETVEMAGDVETLGELTTGATVFDRRRNSQWRSNMEVAVNVNVPAVIDCIIRGLRYAGSASK
ncbi:MAG: nucleoside hydrolase [Pirellulaceae bacterium]